MAEDHKVCPRCGRELPATARFCSTCGYKFKEAKNQSIAERVSALKSALDEMTAALKTYSFQELELIMLTKIKQDELYTEATLDQTSDKSVAAVQRNFTRSLSQLQPAQLKSALAESEALKISMPGKMTWKKFEQTWGQLKGQLKAQGQWRDSEWSFDFAQIFGAPLARVGKDQKTAKAAGLRIIEQVGTNLEQVNDHALHQLQCLGQLRRILDSIGA